MKFDNTNEIRLDDLVGNNVRVKLKNSVTSKMLKKALHSQSEYLKLDDLLIISGKLQQKKSLNIIDFAESNLLEIKMGKSSKSKSTRKPKFPIKLSEALGRIIGHVIGDGGIRKNKFDYTVYYVNKNRDLIESFKNDVTKVFGKVNFLEFNDNGVRKVYAPSIVGLIL